MIALLFMLALAESPGCRREAGTAQCVEITCTAEGCKGRASCYTKTNKDGGYEPKPIKCESLTFGECQAQLDKKAREGCRE